MKELSKTYDPREVEGKIYQMWLDRGCFHAEPDPEKKPFAIVMPPPNVTGQLHMGHALDATLQDILTRFKRMQGYDPLNQKRQISGCLRETCGTIWRDLLFLSCRKK